MESRPFKAGDKFVMRADYRGRDDYYAQSMLSRSTPSSTDADCIKPGEIITADTDGPQSPGTPRIWYITGSGARHQMRFDYVEPYVPTFAESMDKLLAVLAKIG